MAIDSEAIACHGSDQLPRQLVVQVDLEVLAGSDKLEAVAGEVAGEEGVVLVPGRVLQFARRRVPVIDYAVAGHTQKRLLRILLTEFVLHLLPFVEVWSELDAASGRWVAALLSNLALRLVLQDARLEESDCTVSVTGC